MSDAAVSTGKEFHVAVAVYKQRVLTWTDGFYNGEIKTRKIANSAELTADQTLMQRSEQLRELYKSLLSGECNLRATRPVAALSPEDLSDTEWYYVICMTYAFRPGQGLPGRSFASNEYVWLCNAHLADSKTFPRALLAKVYKNRIQSCDQLAAKQWKGDKFCKLCGELETADHIIFQCPVARFIWCVIRDALHWRHAPATLKQWVEIWGDAPDKMKCFLFLIFAAAAWTLWRQRNDLVFRNQTIRSPQVAAHRMMSWMQRWSALDKEKDREKTTNMITTINNVLFVSSANVPAGVG